MKHHLRNLHEILKTAVKWDCFVETGKTEEFFKRAVSTLEELRGASDASDYNALQRILKEFFEEYDKEIVEEVLEELYDRRVQLYHH